MCLYYTRSKTCVVSDEMASMKPSDLEPLCLQNKIYLSVSSMDL